MKILHRRIKTAERFLSIPVLADMHLGSILADHELFKDTIAWVGESKTRLPVFCGDTFEAITSDDKRFLLELFDVKWYGMAEEKRKEFLRDFRAICGDKMCELLDPIAERIVAWVIGNHEWASLLFRGIIKDIANKLKTKYGKGTNEYGGWTAQVKLIFEHSRKKSMPDRSLLIQLEHGYSAPRTPGGLASGLARRTGEFPRPDVIVWAHAHQYLPFCYQDIGATSETKGAPEDIDRFDSRLRWATASPAMVDAYSENVIAYAERRQYRPSFKGVQEIIVNLWDSDKPVPNVRLALVRMGGQTVRMNPE